MAHTAPRAIIFALGSSSTRRSVDPAPRRIPECAADAVCYCSPRLFLRRSAHAFLVARHSSPGTGPRDAGSVVRYGAGIRKEGNLAGLIDARCGDHVWRASRVYDPEGILSTLPALATVLLGVLAGHWLRTDRAPTQKSVALLAAGVVGIGLGLLWNAWFPINKSLWTSSYAVLTAGIALAALALCYYVVDVLGYRRWAQPFAMLGVNALLLFFFSTLVAVILLRTSAGDRNVHRALFDTVFAPWAAPEAASLAYALAYLAVWWVATWALTAGSATAHRLQC